MLWRKRRATSEKKPFEEVESKQAGDPDSLGIILHNGALTRGGEGEEK